MRNKKYIALVVDDEPDMVELVTDMLVSFMDMKVIGLASGYEAISSLMNSSIKYDIIISDIDMRNGTGLEVYRYNDQHNKIPFIFISASEKLPNHEVIFIEKPFKFEALKTAVLSSLLIEEIPCQGSVN